MRRRNAVFALPLSLPAIVVLPFLFLVAAAFFAVRAFFDFFDFFALGFLPLPPSTLVSQSSALAWRGGM